MGLLLVVYCVVVLIVRDVIIKYNFYACVVSC